MRASACHTTPAAQNLERPWTCRALHIFDCPKTPHRHLDREAGTYYRKEIVQHASHPVQSRIGTLFKHFVADTLAPTRSAFYPQMHALAEHDLHSPGTPEAGSKAQTAQAMCFEGCASAKLCWPTMGMGTTDLLETSLESRAEVIASIAQMTCTAEVGV